MSPTGGTTMAPKRTVYLPDDLSERADAAGT